MRADEWIINTHGDASTKERIAGLLNRAFEGLADRQGEGPWRVEEQGVVCRLVIEKGRKEFCDKTGGLLAEYAIAEKEPELIRRYMKNKLAIREAAEAESLVREAVFLLNGEPSEWPEGMALAAGRGRSKRVRKMGLQFAAYLSLNSRLHIDGFIKFRLKEYGAEVREAAETAFEERIMDRQYQEFMTLLKTMVEWQEVRMPTVHLLHGGGQTVQLLDERMQPLAQEEEQADRLGKPTSAYGSGDDQEEESMLVSRLMAASPGHLYIHTAEPDAQVIRTLMGIFGERAALCDDTVVP